MIELKCTLSELFTTLGISDVNLNYVGETGDILYSTIHVGMDDEEFEHKVYNKFIRVGKKLFLVVFASAGKPDAIIKKRHNLIAAPDKARALEICRTMGKSGYEQYKIKPDAVVELSIDSGRKRWEMIWYNPIAQEDRVSYIVASTYDEALRTGILHIMRWAGGDEDTAKDSISSLHTFDGFFDVSIEDAEAAYNKMREKNGK